jgi:hypothetical protein
MCLLFREQLLQLLRQGIHGIVRHHRTTSQSTTAVQLQYHQTDPPGMCLPLREKLLQLLRQGIHGNAC